MNCLYNKNVTAPFSSDRIAFQTYIGLCMGFTNENVGVGGLKNLQGLAIGLKPSFKPVGFLLPRGVVHHTPCFRCCFFHYQNVLVNVLLLG